MIVAILLFVVNFGFLSLAAYFTYESIKEDEPRAPMIGAAGTIFHAALAGFIVFAPGSRGVVAVLLGLMIAFMVVFFRPEKSRPARSRARRGISWAR